MPMAIKATRVANTIINAIAMYSSILYPQNAYKVDYFYKVRDSIT